MDKAIKQLNTARKLLNVILCYLGIFALTSAVTILLPEKGIMVDILQIVFWAFLVVLPFALVSLIFNSGVFVRMAKADATLKRAAQLASSVTLVAGAYILIYIVWAGEWNRLALGLDHNLKILLDASPVLAGLVILATHVFVVRHSLSRLKSTSAA